MEDWDLARRSVSWCSMQLLRKTPAPPQDQGEGDWPTSPVAVHLPCPFLWKPGSPRPMFTPSTYYLWAQEELPLVPAQPTLGPGPSAHHGGRHRIGVTDTQVPFRPSFPFSLPGHTASTIALPPAQSKSKRGYIHTAGSHCDFVGTYLSIESAHHVLPSRPPHLYRHVTVTWTRWTSPSRGSDSLFGNL